MKYLVTGGAGFIGSHIIDELVKRKQEVVVIDNLTTGKKENLQHNISKIRFVQGDIMDSALLDKEMKGVDYVIHLAALISVVESVEKPELYHEINVNGTANVMRAAVKHKVKCFVVPSSCAVYGDQKKIPFTEKMKPMPASPYGQSKLDVEKLCAEFYKNHKLKTIALRWFNVFGPRQQPGSGYAGVISVFAKTLLEGKEPFIFGDGKQTRDFVYVENMVNAALLACSAKKGFGKFYNIGTGKETSVNEIYEKINKILGKNIPAVYKPAREGEMARANCDYSKAKKVLGYVPKIGFDEGLKKTIEWFKENN